MRFKKLKAQEIIIAKHIDSLLNCDINNAYLECHEFLFYVRRRLP